MANYGIIITYILIAVATIAAIAFPIKHLIANPKQAKHNKVVRICFTSIVGTVASHSFNRRKFSFC